MEPIDGGFEPLVEIPFRFPAGELLDFLLAAQQSFDLAFFWSDTLFVGDDFCGRSNLVDEFLCQLADGDFVLGGDIYFLADGVVTFCDGNESVSGVLDVNEVTCGCE